MRKIHIILVHVWLSTVSAVYDKQYMDVINPVLLKPGNDSYFGYSLTYFNNDLYISAPAAADNSQIYKYTISSMLLFKIKLTMKPEMPITKKYEVQNWFGASMKRGSSFIVICAPRAPFMHGSYRVTRGACTKIVFQDTSLLIKYLPPLIKGDIDSYGWSVEVDKYDRVLVGGPAVVKDKNSGLKIHFDDITAPILAESKNILNLGYSIASGYFLSNISVTYAVSTTYGEHGEGEILFFDESLAFIEKLDSGEVGSMYGATLASARLTDSRSSLLVGAPTWAGSGYNTGAVYVYVPVNDTKFMLKRILKGTASSGQFGSSIANIGDFDTDKIDDFAIGAPYEGRGAVYIYSGFAILSGKTWCRKILPETFNTFGFSLVSVPNINGAGCNDLGIGAPLSNRVFLLKCLPIATIKLYTVHPDIKPRKNLTYYEFEICLNVTYPTNVIILLVQINVDVSHSAAKLENNKGNSIISLKSPLNRFCEKYIINTPAEGNYDEHINLEISASLKSSNANASLPTVLSDRSVTSLTESLWIANCMQQYGRCIPKLKVEMTSQLTTPYVVGTRNTETLNFTIINTGEVAYNACAVVTVAPATIRSIPSECSHNVTGKQIICKPSRWIPQGAVWYINDIEIGTNAVTNKDESIDIHYDVYGHCGDDGEKQSKDFSFPLAFFFIDIDVIGLSSSGKVINVTDQDVRTGKYFQHVYTISNNGPIDLADVTCEIVLFKKSYLQYNAPRMTQQEDNLDTLLGTCAINKDRETEDAVHMTCNISMLPGSSETSILLPLHILPNNFGAIRNENGTIVTSIHLQIPNNDNSKSIYEKTISTTTTLLLETTSLPTWVWIISILIALFLLVIIILILREHRNLSRTSENCNKED